MVEGCRRVDVSRCRCGGRGRELHEKKSHDDTLRHLRLELFHSFSTTFSTHWVSHVRDKEFHRCAKLQDMWLNCQDTPVFDKTVEFTSGESSQHRFCACVVGTGSSIGSSIVTRCYKRFFKVFHRFCIGFEVAVVWRVVVVAIQLVLHLIQQLKWLSPRMPWIKKSTICGSKWAVWTPAEGRALSTGLLMTERTRTCNRLGLQGKSEASGPWRHFRSSFWADLCRCTFRMVACCHPHGTCGHFYEPLVIKWCQVSEDFWKHFRSHLTHWQHYHREMNDKLLVCLFVCCIAESWQP